MSHGHSGGGMGSGHGHGHHHHHHGGAYHHHADQSPAWSMAMQVQKDMAKRRTLTDPRLLVAATLIVFVFLITLPYTMDYMQNRHYAKIAAEADAQAGKAPVEQGDLPDSSGPSAAVLGMVGTTLMGHNVQLPESGADMPGQELAGLRGLVQAQGAPAAEAGRLAGSRPEGCNNIPNAYGMPALVCQSARDTVSQMAAASGLSAAGAGSASGSAQAATPGNFGVSVLPPRQEPAAQATIPSYGGAVRSNDNYYVYIPNQQQFGQPLGQASNAISPAAALAPASLQQPVARPQQMLAAVPRQPMAQRTAFNPNTSGLSSPMGLRRREAEPTVPMLPSTSSADGGQRMRVWVSR